MKLYLLDELLTDIEKVVEKYSTSLYGIDLDEESAFDIATAVRDTFHESIKQVTLEQKLVDMYKNKKPTHEELLSLNKKLILALRENTRLRLGKPSSLVDALEKL